MTKDQFTKLFKYMTQRFDAVDARLEELADKKADKGSMSSLMNAVDGIYDRLDVVETELVAIKSDLRRSNKKYESHERRIMTLEQKTLGTA
ncbi:MAG TPA: hypothetical protein VFS65_02215 [Candidatus Saccharimonadales bacterium]|nr:hypothetical protein [Candidatus Saccharimonadales bacterium]